LSVTRYDATSIGDTIAGQQRTREIRQYLPMPPVFLTRPPQGSTIVEMYCGARGCIHREQKVLIHSIAKTRIIRLCWGLAALVSIAGLSFPYFLLQFKLVSITRNQVPVGVVVPWIFLLLAAIILVSICLGYTGISFANHRLSEGHTLDVLSEKRAPNK
jgi:hypothetical protein